MTRRDSCADAAGPTRRSLLAGLAAVLLVGAPAGAQQRWPERQELRRERRERRQERREALGDPDDRWLTRRQRWRDVRDAVRRGEIHPLRELMQHFRSRTGLEIIDVRYRKVEGKHFYGFKVLTDRGQLRWFVIDAATREIMTMQEALARYAQ